MHPVGRGGRVAPSSMLLRINRKDEDMPKGDVETYHQGGTWKNKVEGDDSAESTHDTKDEAIHAGRDMARSRKVEHIIKNMDGTIAERNSYGQTSAPRCRPRRSSSPSSRPRRR